MRNGRGFHGKFNVGPPYGLRATEICPMTTNRAISQDAGARRTGISDSDPIACRSESIGPIVRGVLVVLRDRIKATTGVHVGDMPTLRCDEPVLRLALRYLLGNCLDRAGAKERAIIKIGFRKPNQIERTDFVGKRGAFCIFDNAIEPLPCEFSAWATIFSGIECIVSSDEERCALERLNQGSANEIWNISVKTCPNNSRIVLFDFGIA